MANLGNTIVNGVLRVLNGLHVNTINGVTVGTSPKFTDTTYTFTNKAPTLSWGATSTVATVGGTNITVTMPANPNTNTTNTAGSADTSSKIFLIGATSQAASPQTYSHDTAYVGTDGCLYSGNAKVLTAHQTVTNKAPTLSWGAAATVAVVGSTNITLTMPANPNTDTKNTAGSTDTSSKIFLIGATSQAANPQTYSHDTAYVGTDGCLYSGGTKVLTAHQTVTNKAPTLAWGAAATVAVVGSTNITLTMPANPNSDTKVKQSNTTSGNWRKVVLSYQDAAAGTATTENTQQVYVTPNVEVQPSTGALRFKKYNQLITGSGTTAQDKGSGVSPRYFPAKWTFNTGGNAADGDIYTLKIPCAGHSYGVYISVNNGTNYYPVVLAGTGRLTTHYGSGTYITVVFESSGSAASIYPLAGGDATTTVTGGAFRVINYYDSNTTYNMVSLGNCKGTCDTAVGTAAKVVTLSGYNLVQFGYVRIKFTNGNSAANPTLNINSKGAKAIYYNGAACPAYMIKAQEEVLLQYNGTQYDIIPDDYGDLDGDYKNV